MTSAPTVTAIGSSQGSELITHEMLYTSSAMTASAKYPDLIYEITFLQLLIFKQNYTMRLLFLLLAFVVLSSEKCDEQKSGGIPKCIQTKIDSIKAQPKWNPPAEVNEYSYKGKRVFLFTSDCCDFVNPLFDSNCNYICAPSGGITGKGDMQCLEFEKEAKLVKLVWKDNR